MRAAFSLAVVCIGALSLGSIGCTSRFTPEAQNGMVIYCPGAGNWDLGDSGIRDGLRRAGFKGQVASVVWSVLANPAIDQTLRLNARLAGGRVAKAIEQYIDKYPGKPISVVGLSAGTGIAMWAMQDLKPGYKVDNVVLLSSSLHHTFDARPALEHVRGKVYVYYSNLDAVLAGPMKIFGTIDGVYGGTGVGEVGLKSPGGQERIVNIGYKSTYRKYGYFGGHTDSTAMAFVENVLSKHLVRADGEAAPDATADAPKASQTTGATSAAKAARGAASD